MTYLLDTHCLVWILSGRHEELPKSVAEDIQYYANSYAISEMTLVEIIQLQQRGKFSLMMTPKEIREQMDFLNISILPLSDGVIDTFYRLPVPTLSNERHADPFDRLIISTALKHRRRLVSHDHRFPWYQKHCKLDLQYF